MMKDCGLKLSQEFECQLRQRLTEGRDSSFSPQFVHCTACSAPFFAVHLRNGVEPEVAGWQIMENNRRRPGFYGSPCISILEKHNIMQPDRDHFSIDEIIKALNRCMKQHPPEGIEKRLHPDANLLAEIVGEMCWRKLDDIPARVIQGEHLEALLKWHTPDEDH
ncbi:MAG: hypothetical protein ACP5OY_09545 [Halothiobacillaceae bacterium]